MLVSYNWLSELVDLSNLTPKEIAEKLTFAGIEVEDIKKLSSATNLVVGYVLECELVPDTHLHLCKIELGPKHGVKQIVCGAPNVRKGIKVIVALPGASLPGGEIKVSTIRGMESNGMCCSLLELGVDKKYVDEADLTGIHELSDEYEIGDEDILKHLGLDDTILNLKLLANRPDLLSLYNVALEVATLFNRRVNPIFSDLKIDSNDSFKVGSETDKCKLFASKIVKGITVKESPIELRKHLIAMGVRSINNIVDIGNYVMLLTGQPLHMYDLDKLPKPELIVKDDYEGDFVALDESTYHINKGDLVVTSDNKPMCLAGIMGGLESSDSLTTKNVVVESAVFDPAQIRRTSTRLNLISESSNRFTHGLSYERSYDALALAVALIQKYCGGVASNVNNYDKVNHQVKRISCSAKKINDILGTEYSIDAITSTLKRAHFVIDQKTSGFIADVPSHRIDVDGVNDLAEEVVRILGFSNVKAKLPVLSTIPGLLTEEQRKVSEIKNYLNNSLYQVLTYVLVNHKHANEFKYLNKDGAYKLINPMTDDHEYVRTSLVPSLLDVVSYNLAHQNKDFGIYEISDVNFNNKKEQYLAIALTGCDKRQGELRKVKYDFYSLKGYLESILNLLRVNPSRYRIVEWNLGGNELHPGRSALLYVGKDLVGYLGELHPNAYQNYSIKNNDVYVLELSLSYLIALPTGSEKFKPIPRFPSVTRDLALLVNEDVKVSEVINIIKKNGGNFVKDVQVFDIYQDESLKGRKSVAVKITLIKDDGTLKDEETNLTIDKIKIALNKENISIR